MRVSPWDITLILGQATEIPGSGLIVEDHTGVTFSPQQFKSFAAAALNAMEGYERVFGKLTLPEQFQQTALTADQVEAGLRSSMGGNLVGNHGSHGKDTTPVVGNSDALPAGRKRR